VLEASDVVVTYDRRRPPVLAGVDLAVEPGRALGLRGPSGCGKSTLARVLALLQRPDRGTVRVDGETVTGWRHRAPRHLRTAVGIVFQEPRLAVDPHLTLAEAMAEPLRACGRAAEEAVAWWAAEMELTPELLGRRPHEVSDGQLQRACLARTLVLEPRYVICDEIGSMLDASTQARLVGAVEAYRRRTGAGVLAISHDDELLARWCDEVRDLPGAEPAT
jgi:peptide/nickel transport system ATP-binding protein